MSEAKATYKLHVSSKIKQLIERVSLPYEDLQNDLIDISTAGVMTLILTAFVLAYIFARNPTWNGLGEFSIYYILFNLVLLIRFIYSRARNTWTTDEIGNELHNLKQYIEGRTDLTFIKDKK